MRQRVSKLTVLEIITDKYKKKVELKEKELELRKLELDLKMKIIVLKGKKENKG